MNIREIKANIPLITIMLIMTVISSNLNWGKNHWQNIIKSDGKGYYAYLPAIFIFEDLNFGFFDDIEKEKYYNVNTFYDYRSGSNGKTINKYYCGTALAQIPFFLAAHVLTDFTGGETDGYSKLYTVFISAAALFYLGLGLYFLHRLLMMYDISGVHRIITLTTAVFGTHLFYYTVGEAGMSHVYSFAFINMLLYYSKKHFCSDRNNVVQIFILLGVITLIRPVNALIIFVFPFMSENIVNLKKGLLKACQKKGVLFMSSCIFISFISIQFIIYKLSTGSFFVYSYLDEGFDFLNPNIINILFSYKKGLFLYTPILLLSISGIYFIFKNSTFEFISIFSFLFLITYVFSCWWMWYYGGSFSSRVFVEYISLFMIMLAIALERIKARFIKTGFIIALLGLTMVCQVQTYQYRYYQIHWSDMNKEKYWSVFLRLDQIVK
jgi:hypothetical protein